MSLDHLYQEIIDANGIKIPFISAIITPGIERPLRDNSFQSGACDRLRGLLLRGDRVLQIGAGIGLGSSVAAKVDGVQDVTAIEANPELVAVIRETHRLNGLSGIDLRNGVVVATRRKRAPFYLRADIWASSTEAESGDFVKKKHLPCLNIQDLIREKNPTVIVCDLEECEPGLFDDADLSGVRAMLVEFPPKVNDAETVERITGQLKARGLLCEVAQEPSAVRVFRRDGDGSAATSNVEPGEQEMTPKALKPELSGLTEKPWNPDTARFLVTTCMKDEGPFIIEWLAWHKSIGIQDFVIFTNDCSDGTDRLLDRLEEMGELRHLPNPALACGGSEFLLFALAYTPQLPQFRRADFLVSIDVDEFINIRLGTGQMRDLLKKTGPFDALSMSELNHGSNMIEEYQRGLITEQFPRHQREAPGRHRSRRGVKTIVRLGEKLRYIRNHRPVLHGDAGPVTWFDGSGRPLTVLHENRTENGHDVRGTYELAVLDHFPLRSLNSYLVKMFRGDAVVKGKMVGHRYWRQRDRQSDLTSTFERQQEGFQKAHDGLMADKVLARLHDECCVAHEARIAQLLQEPMFQERKQWVFDEIWEPEKAKQAEQAEQGKDD